MVSLAGTEYFGRTPPCVPAATGVGSWTAARYSSSRPHHHSEDRKGAILVGGVAGGGAWTLQVLGSGFGVRGFDCWRGQSLLPFYPSDACRLVMTRQVSGISMKYYYSLLTAMSE